MSIIKPENSGCIVHLGYSELKGKIRYHFFSSFTNRELIFPQSSMNAAGFQEFSLNAPESYWEERGIDIHYRSRNKEERASQELLLTHYMRKLVDDSTKMGYRRNYKIVKHGAWDIKQGDGTKKRVFHLGAQILNHDLSPGKHGLLSRDHISFACNGMGELIEKELVKEEMDEFEKFLTMRSWQTKISPMLIMGALYASCLSGLLSWRPHLWINAPAATGKSAISDAVLDLFGDGKGCFFAAGDKSTESGLRRGTDGKAFLLLYEEAEGEVGDALDQIILLARGASDGKPIKQTNKDSHEDEVFNCYCMFMMFSIGNNLDKAADASRFIPLNLMKNDRLKRTEYAAMDKIREKYWNSDMGRRIHYDAYKNADMFLSLTNMIKDMMGYDRYTNNIAPLLAGYYMIKKETNVNFIDKLISLLNEFDPALINPMANTETDTQKFVDAFMMYELALEINQVRYTRSVSTWLAYATEMEDPGDTNLTYDDRDILKALEDKGIGLKSVYEEVIEDGKSRPKMCWKVFVKNSCPALRKVLDSGNVKRKLKTIMYDLGAEEKRIRLNKTTTRTYCFDLSKIMDVEVDK